jgi:hypothetical protein
LRWIEHLAKLGRSVLRPYWWLLKFLLVFWRNEG